MALGHGEQVRGVGGRQRVELPGPDLHRLANTSLRASPDLSWTTSFWVRHPHCWAHEPPARPRIPLACKVPAQKCPDTNPGSGEGVASATRLDACDLQRTRQ